MGWVLLGDAHPAHGLGAVAKVKTVGFICRGDSYSSHNFLLLPKIFTRVWLL